MARLPRVPHFMTRLAHFAVNVGLIGDSLQIGFVSFGLAV